MDCVVFFVQDPEAPSSWEGTRDASIPAEPCPQVSYVSETEGGKEIFGSEDCLYLNVFSNQVSRRHVFETDSYKEVRCICLPPFRVYCFKYSQTLMISFMVD